MTNTDRALAPTKADFVAGTEVPVEPVSAIEGAREAGHLGIKALMVG